MSKDTKDSKRYEGMRTASSQNYNKNAGMGTILINSNKGLSGLEFKELESQFAFETGNESKYSIIQQIVKDKNSEILKKDPKFFNDFGDDFDDDDL